jgi:hypothetical protein
VQRFHRLCDAAHQAVWLGVLDQAQFQQLTDYHYNSTKSASIGRVNYFGEGHNLKGFFPWERAAFDTHFGGCTSVLVGSAGGGREVLAVSRRGVKVDAFECNPDLAESCRSFLASHGVVATVITARPNEVPESLGMYDGAILGWSGYMHIAGRKRRIGFLQEMRRHIRPGGPFLLSFFLYHKDSWFPSLTYQVARAIRMLRRAEPLERGDSLRLSFDHRFTEAEIRQELTAAGFDVVSYSERLYGHAVARAIRGSPELRAVE